MKLSKRVADLEAKAKPAVKYITCWADLVRADADSRRLGDAYDGPTEFAPSFAVQWQRIVEACGQPRGSDK